MGIYKFKDWCDVFSDKNTHEINYFNKTPSIDEFLKHHMQECENAKNTPDAWNAR